jgi:hypothetical protein
MAAHHRSSGLEGGSMAAHHRLLSIIIMTIFYFQVCQRHNDIFAIVGMFALTIG